jgi:hypothetical protein
LEKDACTDLALTPFVYMEGTLHTYEKFSIDRAKTEVGILTEEVKRFGGDFYCLWHNETIAERGQWKGWNEVLDFTLSQFPQ